MPKGRRYGKKKAMARRRKYARRGGLRRPVKSVHHFKEQFRLPNILVAANSQVSGTIAPQIANLLNYANFKQLFDLYKITGVKLKFLYRGNSADTQGSAGATGIPVLYTAINRDPAVPAPASIADLLNDDTCRIHRGDGLLGKGGVYIKSPKPDMQADVVNKEGIFIGTTIQQLQLNTGSRSQFWLTTGGNGQTIDQSVVKHYGLRWFLDNTFNAADQVVEVYATMYFSMKEQD